MGTKSYTRMICDIVLGHIFLRNIGKLELCISRKLYK